MILQAWNLHHFILKVHAADVTQSSHFMLSQTGLANSLSDMELLAILFAAACHDLEHTGYFRFFFLPKTICFQVIQIIFTLCQAHNLLCSTMTAVFWVYTSICFFKQLQKFRKSPR